MQFAGMAVTSEWQNICIRCGSKENIACPSLLKNSIIDCSDLLYSIVLQRLSRPYVWQKIDNIVLGLGTFFLIAKRL